MASIESITTAQRDLCRRLGLEPVAAEVDMKVGLARNVASGIQPVNGLRHPPEGDTTGWYIWAGEEPGQEPDFFQPVHVQHLHSICPAVIPYLALPPGWRFLVAPKYEDVWEDASLLSPA
jgi:hypothetical protein